MSSISDNISEVRERIERAADRAGRKPEDITLIAVTKTVGVDAVKEAINAGVTQFGENRVQMLLEKQEDPALTAPGVGWHLIGHLQTNKVKYVVGRVQLIHSVDSLHLAEEINRCAKKAGIVMPILLQLNISGEESKSGLSPDGVSNFLYEFSNLDAVKLKGLMTMTPLAATDGEKRRIFRNLYNIYVDIGEKPIYNVDMSILSMGMSGDFEIAVEEGATMVRIGTKIFK